MEDELTKTQQLKKDFFENNITTLSDSNNFRRSKKFKKSDDILNNILRTKEFTKLRNYMNIKKVMGNFLNQKLQEMVIFGFYKDQKITIKVMHPVAQTEINYRKKDIIAILKQIPDFEDITEVTVFREDRVRRFSSEFDEKFYNEYHPHAIKNREKEYLLNQMHFIPERSVGIFENKSTTPSINNKFEDIRELIKKNRELEKDRK